MNSHSAISQIPGTSFDWSPLYKWSARLSIVMLLLIPFQIAVFVISPPPQTVEGFFKLYQSNWLLGLLSLDLIYILNNVILIFIYLGLAVRMFHERPTACLTAFILGLIGIASYFPSNPAFEMLTLSTKYFGAPPSTQQLYLAAGEALLAGYTGTAFDVYYVLNAAALLLFASAILNSTHFKKTAGVWGIISGIFMIVPSSAGLLGMVFSLLSLIPWAVFLFLLIPSFRALAKAKPTLDNSLAP